MNILCNINIPTWKSTWLQELLRHKMWSSKTTKVLQLQSESSPTTKSNSLVYILSIPHFLEVDSYLLSSFQKKNWKIHPKSLTWNLNMMLSKWISFSKGFNFPCWISGNFQFVDASRHSNFQKTIPSNDQRCGSRGLDPRVTNCLHPHLASQPWRTKRALRILGKRRQGFVVSKIQLGVRFLKTKW